MSFEEVILPPQPNIVLANERFGCGHPQRTIDPDQAPMPIRHPEWSRVADARLGQRTIGGGEVVREIPGAGKVYDWRGTSWTAPMVEGSINPLLFVHHIPVVRNVEGISDFITLRNVLVAQGLGVQSSTDREGNVALFCDFDVMCYHARGGNTVSFGCEHMHFTTGEDWTERQFRAAAWLVNQLKNKSNVPAYEGTVGAGNGAVRVIDEGQTTHEVISDKAGFHDRSDPGPGYRINHVRNLVIYYREHDGSFVGAPPLGG